MGDTLPNEKTLSYICRSDMSGWFCRSGQSKIFIPAVRFLAAFVGEFGKFWEDLRVFRSIAARRCDSRCGGGCRKTEAVLCVGQVLPPAAAILGVGGLHYPACCSPERSVNRLFTPKPSQTFPKHLKFFQLSSFFAGRLCGVCVKYYKIYCLLNFAAYLVFIWRLN